MEHCTATLHDGTQSKLAVLESR